MPPSYSPCLPVTGDLDCSDVSGACHRARLGPLRLDNDGGGAGLVGPDPGPAPQP